MYVIHARNVHQALPKGIRHLQLQGVDRASRNGPVRQAVGPVATVYARPLERVVFWPERDANPAFHIYEALWMLAGRRDLAPLMRYASNFGQYSDDGETLHGAYGYRWRHHFHSGYEGAGDQLTPIADQLRQDPTDRRCVLQMWSPFDDLGRRGKDVPCNLTATFQRDVAGALDMTVFNRSNDIIWGAYGANAVHFGFLQEYLALWIGCPVGTYTQVSVNFHAYHTTLAPLQDLPGRIGGSYAAPAPIPCPYAGTADYVVRTVPLREPRVGEAPEAAIEAVDAKIRHLLRDAETGFQLPRAYDDGDDEPGFEALRTVLRAHHQWKTLAAPERYDSALAVLAAADQTVDWIVAMQHWVTRRRARWEAQVTREAVPS